MSSRFVKVILVLTCVVSSVFATLSSQAQVPVTVVFSDGLTGQQRVDLRLSYGERIKTVVDSVIAHSEQPENLYWSTARLCTPKLQQRLEARRVAVLAELQLLSTVYKNTEQPELAERTQQLYQQVQRWPLLASLAAGIMPARLIAEPENNWQLTRHFKHYFLRVVGAPHSIHWVGLTPFAGTYPWSQDPLFKRLKNRALDNLWEVPLQGFASQRADYRALTPREVAVEQINWQPGQVLFQGYDDSDLPAGFSGINQRLLNLLIYWAPNQSLAARSTNSEPGKSSVARLCQS